MVADRLWRLLAPERPPRASLRHEVLELVEDIQEMLAGNCIALAPLAELHEALPIDLRPLSTVRPGLMRTARTMYA